MFDFLRGILAKTESGVHYFGAGCLFLRPPAVYDKSYDYVGVNGTDGAFLGDFLCAQRPICRRVAGTPDEASRVYLQRDD